MVDPRQRLRLSRQELFQSVWSIPTTKIATRLGISDVAIAKICRKLKYPSRTLDTGERLKSDFRSTTQGWLRRCDASYGTVDCLLDHFSREKKLFLKPEQHRRGASVQDVLIL